MATTSKKATKPATKPRSIRVVKKPVRAKKQVRSTGAKTQSFKIVKPDKPFLTFQPSVQTLYWVILGIVTIAFTLWIYKLDSDIQAIYDQIDASQVYLDAQVPSEE